jgi:aerobic carbon-monoxide dehydrogenase large subunit
VSILGTRVPRTEDPRFLTTGGVYTADVASPELAGACHLSFVRSPVAHARILGIEAGPALRAPGTVAVFTVAVFTGADLAGLPLAAPPMPGINELMGQPPLARDTVRYVGEPVAVVVTDDPQQGEDAAELVEVDYDPLPSMVDPEDAAAAGPGSGTLLFPAAGTNVTAAFGDPAALDAGLFDGCDAVVEATIVNQRLAPAPMEARAGAAVWGGDGRLTMWVPNQGAQGTRDVLAELLGIEAGRIRVITPDVGGAFGAKFGADPEHAVVAWVARRLGRPARWAETRHENMIAMTHGRAQLQRVTIGGSRDGRVQAYRLEILQDAGAYPRFGAFLPALTIMMASGPYAFPRAEAVARSVVTNTTPVGAYRGAGRPEATAAVERTIDLFAAEIGADPAEVRLANLLPRFTEPHQTSFGARYDSGGRPPRSASGRRCGRPGRRANGPGRPACRAGRSPVRRSRRRR